MPNQAAEISKNFISISRFISTQLLVSFERLGLHHYWQGGEIDIESASEKSGLNSFFLLTACEFLTEQYIFKKTDAKKYTLAVDQTALEQFINFFNKGEETLRLLTQHLKDRDNLYPGKIGKKFASLMGEFEKLAASKKFTDEKWTEHISDYIGSEICIALERLDIFDRMVKKETFSAKDIASEETPNEALLAEMFNFLVSRGIISKNSEHKFSFTAAEYKHIEWRANFLLAYEDVFRAFGPLIDGSKIYGRDMQRRGVYLKDTVAFSRGSYPFITKRLKELRVSAVLDIGCGSGELLTLFIDKLPGIRGIGIEIDKPTVDAVQKTLSGTPYGDTLQIFNADGRMPKSFPPETAQADAIISIAVFHEFRRGDRIFSILHEYKETFPHSRLFIVELNIPSWDDLFREPVSLERQLASFYKFTHVFSDQGLPQSKAEWTEILARSGWRVIHTETVPVRLVIYECE